MAQPVFKPGETVVIRSRAGLSPVVPVDFKIIRQLPDNRGETQYRIRNDAANHERVEMGRNLSHQQDASNPWFMPAAPNGGR